MCVSGQAVKWSVALTLHFFFYDNILQTDCIVTYLLTQVGFVGYGLLYEEEQGECKVNRNVEL